MHESARRLYEAAKTLAGTAGQSAVAALLNESPQTVKNWESRGVSADGAINAEAVIGCRAAWVRHGTGAMLQASTSPDTQLGVNHPNGGVTSYITGDAHAGSPEAIILPELLRWEDVVLMTPGDLPGEFRLPMPDDALAPATPRGTVLIFSTSAKPAPGLGVLVEDSGGRRYVRRYAEGPDGAWLAKPRSDAHAELRSDVHGLRVLAVVTGRMDGAV